MKVNLYRFNSYGWCVAFRSNNQYVGLMVNNCDYTVVTEDFEKKDYKWWEDANNYEPVPCELLNILYGGE